MALADENYAFYMATDLSAYLGEWVAIVEKKVVAHGSSVKDVYGKAKRSFPGKVPFLACVPKPAAMIL